MKRPIFGKLYQFSQYIPRMDFTIHQYLLATGTVQQAERSLPEIEEILGGDPWTTSSSPIWSRTNTEASAFSWRDIPMRRSYARDWPPGNCPGWGWSATAWPLTGTRSSRRGGDISLKTITYPCEVHLQDGIIAYEQNSGYCTAPTLCKAPGMAGIRSRNADIFPERRASPPYAYRTRRDWKIPNGSSHPYPRGSWRWAMGLFRQRRHYVNN